MLKCDSYSLPRDLLPATLKGELTTLRPLDLSNDMPILYSLSNGSAIHTDTISIEPYDPDKTLWKYLYWPRSGTDHYLEEFYRANFETCRFFTILDNKTNSPIGSIGYGYISPEHLNLEIIKAWISPVAQGRGMCAEALRLVVEHAFDMGYRTIHYRVSVVNIPSIRLAEKVGFKLEIKACDAIISNRNIYDVLFYSISRISDFNRFS